MNYIVIWKNDDAGKVWTVEDASGTPVRRDFDNIKSSVYAVISDPAELEQKLAAADGTRYGVSIECAREVLGWDLT